MLCEPYLVSGRYPAVHKPSTTHGSRYTGCLKATVPLHGTGDPTGTDIYTCIYVCVYVRRFQNVVPRCPTPRLHRFLSSHWPSFRFLSVMAFLIHSIQFFFGLPPILFCFGIHFNVILGNLPSVILWTWSYRVSCLCSISFIIKCTYMAITHRHVRPVKAGFNYCTE